MRNRNHSFLLPSLLLGPILIGAAALHSEAAYQIKKGDSLSKIAQTKYGNLEKWRELWDLNKAAIKDPHWIYPGQRLRLMNEGSLTLVASNAGTGSNASLPASSFKRRSQEWRLLPIQNWEKFVFPTDPLVDPTGFDRRSNIGERFAEKTLSPMAIAPDRIPILGEISASRSNFEKLNLGDTVMIRADEALQVGTTYSVTPGPEKVSSSRDGRVAFTYVISGKVKVIGVRDGVFVGTITSLYHPIDRGNLLIPEVQPLVFQKAIPCPSAVQASVMVQKSGQEDLIGQQRIVFLDVGSDDGVRPGMIFRQYLHQDPYTKESLTSRDFLIESELQVLDVQDRFAIAIVINSRSGVHADDEVVALTDLKDFDRNQGLQGIIQDRAKPASMDDLDRLDSSDGIGEKENRDLRQLEIWSKSNPSAGTGAGVSEDEIKKETLKPANPSPELGNETAPNDQSNAPKGESPQTAPEAPEAAPAPAPAEPPSGEAPPPEAMPSSSAPPEPTPAPQAPAPTPSAPSGEVKPQAAPPPSMEDSLQSAPLAP